MNKIKIDGSVGEGGGQVFRNSISYASLSKSPLKIINIRVNRSPSGLKPQHLTALKLISRITKAEVSGDYKGSEEVFFNPKTIQGGSYSIDTGTAASLTLVLQAVLPITLFADSHIELKLRGGTDVKWSPPIDSFRYVFILFLNKIGANCRIELVQRGHYPRGGGIVKFFVDPLKTPLQQIKLKKREEINSIRGRSHCVSLPKHVAERQAKAARERLNNSGYKNISIEVEWYEKSEDPHLGPGSGIVLWVKNPNLLLEADALGEKGKPAEKVGRQAANKLLTQIERGGAVDVHHTDHLIPFMAIAQNKSIIHSSKLSSHTLTAIKIAEKFFNVDFSIDGKKGEEGYLSIKGTGIN